MEIDTKSGSPASCATPSDEESATIALLNSRHAGNHLCNITARGTCLPTRKAICLASVGSATQAQSFRMIQGQDEVEETASANSIAAFLAWLSTRTVPGWCRDGPQAADDHVG